MGLTETWKKIDGHPDYEVSDLGRVRSNKKTSPLIMRTRTDRYGHHKLELDGKTRKLHQLVANAFIPMPNQHMIGCNVNTSQYDLCICPIDPLCVRHKDDDKNNNAVSNLCWGTYSENLIDAYRNGRRGKQ